MAFSIILLITETDQHLVPMLTYLCIPLPCPCP